MKKQKLQDDCTPNSVHDKERLKSKDTSRRNFIKSAVALTAASVIPIQVGAARNELGVPLVVSRKKKIGLFKGIMPIMATPVDKNHKIDLVSQRRHVDYCIQAGAVAVGHFAHASEFKKINDTDRTRLLEVCVDQVDGRVPFYAGVTGKTSKDIIRYAREAEQKGADMIMTSIPYGDKIDQIQTLAMFNDLASACSLPIIIQDTDRTSHILTPELIMKVANDTKQIHSVKAESTLFLSKTEELLKQFDGVMQVIGGNGGKYMINLLRVGATAFMTGTEAVEVHAACINTYLAGNEDEAAKIYFSKILPYFAYYAAGNWKRNLKFMLHERGVIDTNIMLLPDDQPAGYTGTELKEFQWTLDKIGWNRDWKTINE
ncbi:MAG: dihydrodipicolinate synthase family protein [Flavobacteriaceae bacterium]|nr:dihydrodipicolinate synthase family protein [Flavobacteriaceae bacterium]